MIEIHTGILCDTCKKKFYSLITTEYPLSKEIEGHANCPGCGKHYLYKYEYETNFKCIPTTILGRFFNWVLRTNHCIVEHFTKTESVGTELFPRHCLCGEDILLIQRRTL